VLLNLIHYNAMNMGGRVVAQLHAFIISLLDRGKWSPSYPGCSTW